MTTPEFQRLVTLANRVAAKFNGSRDTCVLTSFALHDVLRRLGYSSRLLRIEAAVFPVDRKLCGTILGSLNGCRQAASPNMWHGHLAVAVEDKWLLDPTLDQANKKEWPRSMRVGPLAIRLSEKFWAERGSILIQVNKCSVRFSPHPRQVGFANAGDARPSHWKPLVDQIFRALEAQMAKRKVRREKAVARRSCVDCSCDTCPPRQPDEWFMVHDELWTAVGMTPDGGCLCVECLERRLGRQLNRADFTDARVNDPDRSCSPRLRDRLRRPG